MGAISSLIYGYRNADKVLTKGDIGRAPVPLVQTYNAVCDAAINGASNGLEHLSKGADGLLMKTVGKEKAVKAFSVTSKLVNPLLCGAAAVRVIRDKDSKSDALVEESLAMGSMFAAEGAFKTVRAIAKSGINNGNFNSVAKDLSACKNIGQHFKTSGTWLTGKMSFLKNKKVTETLQKISKNKNAKTALFIGAELLFVCASIFGYDLGKKIGKKITGRDKKDIANVEKIPKEVQLLQPAPTVTVKA